ncbi:MAG: DUF2239 family protein [Oligoflexus sp.]
MFYEAALQALYAGQKEIFHEQIDSWPRDVKKHILRLSEQVFR